MGIKDDFTKEELAETITLTLTVEDFIRLRGLAVSQLRKKIGELPRMEAKEKGQHLIEFQKERIAYLEDVVARMTEQLPVQLK